MTRVTFLILLLLPSHVLRVEGSEWENILQQLTQKKFSVVETAVIALGQSSDQRAQPLLEAMLANELYQRKSDKQLVRAVGSRNDYTLYDIFSGSELAKEVSSRQLNRIRVNNKIRSTLRNALARLALSDPDPKARSEAARKLRDGQAEEILPLLQQALADEKVESVREVLRFSLATLQLKHPDSEIRRQSVTLLSGSLDPDVRNLLTELLQKDPSGNWNEPELDIREKITATLKQIEFWEDIYGGVETLFFGVSLGSVLLLAAIGLAVTFGVMGVINMAHGEMIMLGAYTTYVIQKALPNLVEYSLFISIPAAFLVAGTVGIILERTVIRLLYGRPLETLLATFGVSLFLQQAVRSIFGPLNQNVLTPSWMQGALEINPLLSITYNRLTIILFVPFVLLTLFALLKRSHFGLEMRAVTQNRRMANAMGIRADQVDALTFGLGSGIAGIAGVALSQLTNVGPNLGQSYIIDSFMVVVFGGVGNLWGTFFGAMSLGLANKLLEPFAGAVAAKIIVLVLIILFLQKRPRGMFALKGRFVEN
ncbi:MAG: urea ABC transporter permease subunit UrtB [bacterium]|jgi:urea transport system permease protein